MLAGYNRMRCNIAAGNTEIPAIIKGNISDEVAKIIVVHTNTKQRGLTSIKPSELGFVLKTELGCFVALRKQLRRQGIRSGEINAGNGNVFKFEHVERTRDTLAKNYGLNPRDVQNLIQPTDLVPELLELVDCKRHAVNAAVKLTLLPEDVQYELHRAITEDRRKVSIQQADALKQQ